MTRGSCCCGEVRFSISKQPRFLATCHCSRCRKLGTSTFAMVYADGFELLSGRDRIVEYPPEPPNKYRRSFCGSCGTSLGEILSDGEMFPIPADCFDDDLGMQVAFHEHVASKPSWSVVPEGSKQFEHDPS